MRTEPLPAISCVALEMGRAGSFQAMEYALANVLEFLPMDGGDGPAEGEVR